ncbi:MAG TPA: hypothetical protein PKW33_18015 [Anaerolineaceae bacterium]|nr:hypothetical protein [Anaerolineaceae bacterium]HPN53497.1 hypothetical protein [Anaerolineaceae bacterium]
MKKLSLILLVAVLTIGLVGNAFAEAPAPGGPFSTAFTIQNTSGGAANCSFVLYDSTGASKYTSSPIAMAADASSFVYVPSLSVDSGSYSGVVSCDAPVAAIVNFSSTISGASHAGVGAAAATWYVPVVYDNYYNFYTNFYVQNATASPVDITISYYAPGSATPVTTETATAVPGYATHIFQQEGNATLANNVSYSAKITATGNVAAIVNIYGKSTANGQVYSFNAFTAGSKTAYVPQLMKNYYGYNTALTVQNISAVDATVTVTYGNGATAENAVIAAYSSKLFYTPNNTSFPSGATGISGATITSVGGDIVAVVNESDGYNRAATYAGFTTGTSKVFAPIVMKRYYGYNTSIVCQNVGTTDTVATLSYTAGGLSHTVVSPTLAQGATYMFYQPSDGSLPNSYNGSAVINASASGKIICTVNENQNEAPQATQIMDQLFSYNGINQ